MKVPIFIALIALATAVGAFVYNPYGGQLMLGATSFPASLDSFTNPSATDSTATVSHSGQHSNANDAIEALQAKVGIDGSAVNTTHDFKLSGVADGDYACSLTGTETLTNKTLTSATATTPYMTNPNIVDRILDSADNIMLRFTETASAVNYLLFDNQSTGNGLTLTATGTDSNVGITIDTKGTGVIDLNDTTYIGDASLIFPDSDGTSGQVINTDGAGNLGWTSPAGVTGTTSDSTIGGYTLDGSTAIMVIAKGDFTGTANEQTVSLKLGSETLDTVHLELPASADVEAWSLAYFGTPAATTTDVTVSVDAGTLQRTNIVILEL